ncbi:alpha/beta hydrolase [Streptomyces sp. NPDC021749]|uniref:alpha/beta hydrolase n=1 Tax=Streptomyces sp. NPDC021749 TaxID=3154905 RepID=UPI0033F59980
MRNAAPGPAPDPAPAPEPDPARTVLGAPDAPRHAVVLAPVMARWDHGAFFRQVAAPLIATGHRVTVHDTLSLLRDGDDLTALANRWAHRLEQDHDTPDVLAGNALGGAVVQILLARAWARRAKILLLSGPTVADDGLNGKLERIAAAVGDQGLPVALRLLEEVVRGPAQQASTVPEPVSHREPAQPPSPDEELAGWRLSSGLRLLHDLDLTKTVRAFPGRLLHVYGEQSRLVQRHHLATGPSPQHHRLGIPHAGMRPHADQPALTRDAVARFLGEEQT